MRILAFNRLGSRKGSPRLFLESQRLEPLGFTPGMPVYLHPGVRRVEINTHPGNFAYHISRRCQAGGTRPLLDVNSRLALQALSDFDEVKITGTPGRLVITPSVRAFAILRGDTPVPPYDTVEFFCGGGTLSQAFTQHPAFRMRAGVELEPRFADVWQRSHPQADLIQGDLRKISPLEIPRHQVLLCGIPCTDHSNLGRAKKGLAGCAETGETGDLFMDVAAFIRHHLPSACVLENVPSFGTSLAGQALLNNLAHMGYHLSEAILEPHREWGEISHRRRWVCIATRQPGFAIQIPQEPCQQTAGAYLDPEDPQQDQADASRIAGTIAGLRRHHDRHQAQGNGFWTSFSLITRESPRIPTIVKSYHKINVGPFVKTPYGPRLLRQGEIERIHGAKAATDHYATAVEILGQGVLTRIFHRLAGQLASFLQNPQPMDAPPVHVGKTLHAEQLAFF